MQRRMTLACILGVLSLAGGCNSSGGDNDSMLGGMFKDLMPPTPSETARDVFDITDADKRRRAVNLLANASWGGEEPYMKAYRTLVSDEDPTVRAAAIRALARHGGPDDVMHIAPALNPNAEHTAYVRWEAAMALQRIHSPKAIDPLVIVVREDEEADVRQAAARALAQYAELRVFEALVGALSDEDFGVVRRAAESLTMLTGQNYGEDSAKWLAWSEANSAATMFTKQQPYTFQEYIRPPGFLDNIQFWKKYPTAEAKPPTGAPGTEYAVRTVAPSPSPAAVAAPAASAPSRSPSTSAPVPVAPAPRVAERTAPPPTPAPVMRPETSTPAPAAVPVTTVNTTPAPKPAAAGVPQPTPTAVKPPAPAAAPVVAPVTAAPTPPAPASPLGAVSNDADKPATAPAAMKPATPVTAKPSAAAAAPAKTPAPTKPAPPVTTAKPAPAPVKTAATATPAAQPGAKKSDEKKDAPAAATPAASSGAAPQRTKTHPLGASDGREAAPPPPQK